MNKRGKKRQKNIALPIPPITTQTQKVLEMMTDPAGFQRLSDDVLSACWDYKISPRGVNIHGTIAGQPDSWAVDANGKLCALAYGISSDGDWETKLNEDLENVYAFTQKLALSSRPSVFIFCTNCSINSSHEQILKEQIQTQYGWELRLFGSGEFSICLDTKRQDLRYKHFKISVEHHNWQSLLAACQNQRQHSSVRPEVSIDADLYIPRHLEHIIDAWYYQAIQIISLRNTPSISSPETMQGDTFQQLFVVVDQAGAGKSTLVLHLAERYGNVGPVIVLPGSMTITHDHALKHAIVEALKDGNDSRTYHSDLKALCQLAQSEGYPLLVIIDAIDANSEPKNLQNALKQLLTSYRNSSLLILLTCRDVAWPHFSDPLFPSFAYTDPERPAADTMCPLGFYDGDEFELARDRYFHRWDIRADLGPNAAHVLHSPLLLRVFAQAYAGRSLGYVPEIVDNELWNKYWENKIEVVSRGMEHSLDQEAISNVLETVAERMVEYDRLQLPLSDLRGIDYLDPYDTKPKSLMTQLQNAGIFQKTLGGGRSNTIHFVYDLFLEFVLARRFAHEFEQPLKRVAMLDRVEKLAAGYRWHQVPLYLTDLIPESDTIIDKLRGVNLWLASRALLRSESRATSMVRQHIIQELVATLSSRYTLNCRRASRYLGLLRVHESGDALLACWSERQISATVQALARLGRIEIINPFIRYLGRYPQWYLLEDQELVNTLPDHFRDHLRSTALAMLGDPECRPAAVQTLGFLRAEDAIDLLLAQFESSECTDEAILLALLHIGTRGAFDAIERAFTEIGKRIEDYDRQIRETRTSEKPLLPPEQKRNEIYSTLMAVRMHGIQHSSLKEMLPFLSRLLEHPNFHVRSAAIHSLQALKAAEMTVSLILSARLSENEAITRALESFGPQISIEPILVVLEDATIPDQVLRYAIQALGFSRDPRALGPLRMFMDQQRCLFDTIQALGHLGRLEAIPVLAQVLARDLADNHNQHIIYDFAIIALGRLRHLSAFTSLKRFARRIWPDVEPAVIEALVATGREKALTLLSEIWSDSVALLTRRTILGALLWLNTEKAITTLLQLLTPIDVEKLSLLISEMMLGKNLGWIDGQITHEPLDDRIVVLIASQFDYLPLKDQHHALFALADTRNSSARHWLESIARNPAYDIPLPAGANLYEQRTLRTEALRLLRDEGASVTIESVLDEILAKAVQGFTGGEVILANMEREVVIEALRKRLSSADEIRLVRLLELLGFFGDSRSLSEIHLYTNDPRSKVANAAYETEQRIIGVMDIWEW